MCFSGSGGRMPAPSPPPPAQLPLAPQVAPQTMQMLQSTPARPRTIEQTGYKKKGKRALTIPQNTTGM